MLDWIPTLTRSRRRYRRLYQAAAFEDLVAAAEQGSRTDSPHVHLASSLRGPGTFSEASRAASRDRMLAALDAHVAQLAGGDEDTSIVLGVTASPAGGAVESTETADGHGSDYLGVAMSHVQRITLPDGREVLAASIDPIGHDAAESLAEQISTTLPARPLT